MRSAENFLLPFLQFRRTQLTHRILGQILLRIKPDKEGPHHPRVAVHRAIEEAARPFVRGARNRLNNRYDRASRRIINRLMAA